MSGDYYIDETDIEHNYLCSFDELIEKGINVHKDRDVGYNLSQIGRRIHWYVNGEMVEFFGSNILFMFIKRNRLPEIIDQVGPYTHTMLRGMSSFSSGRVWLNDKCFYPWYSWHKSWFKNHVDFFTDEDFLI